MANYTDECYQIPEGYTIIANRVVLMLVRIEDVGNKRKGVKAVCKISGGSQELLRRYYNTIGQG